MATFILLTLPTIKIEVHCFKTLFSAQSVLASCISLFKSVGEIICVLTTGEVVSFQSYKMFEKQ